MRLGPEGSWSSRCLGILLTVVTFAFAEHGPCALLETGSSSICISLEEINLAFRQARLGYDLLEPLEFSPHKPQHHHHDIDRLGLVLVETSRILAKTYKLDYEQIFEHLPKLDVETTDIWKFCPVIFKEKNCKISKYRTLSGHCNNLNHPDWGAAITPFNHILPADRHDGLSEPREYGKHLDPLPSARLVSATIHRDKVIHDHAITIMLIAWGQIIDHDITFTAETKDIGRRDKDLDCCSEHIYESRPPPRHHNCYPIRIADNDDFYSHHNHHCMSFARSSAGVRTGCRLGPRTAFNTISSFLDGSFAYGSNVEQGRELRSGEGGALKSLPLFTEHGLKDLLPLKVDEPEDGCIRPNSDIFCFLAGDVRVNEQLVLTTLHTIFMRQHNAIAHSLEEINPHWDDEKIYQETRRIIIAIIQHITFNEFLPMILGKDLLKEYGLSVEDGYWTGYDPYKNPGALEEFITSAFRFGHSLLPHKIERWTTSHHYIDSTKLHEMLRQPFNMFRPGHVDTFIMGLVNQLAQAMDEGVTDQVTTLLFKEKNKNFGMDLAAMNIQRGRDHGVPSFAAYRKICDLSPIGDWDDLIGVMRNETVYKYKKLYRSPWDIDLWSGGVSETPKPGKLLGPTFGCIIARQFQAIRYGDRFWYELPDLPSSFTLDQLNEIKSMKLSRLLCDNGDAIKSVQTYAMVHPDHKINPRVPCYSKSLPRIDLKKWREERHHSEDAVGHQSILQQAHSHTDLETIKPPLHDKYFELFKTLENNGTSYDRAPGSQSYLDPYPHEILKDTAEGNPIDLYGREIPPFKRMPDDDEDDPQSVQGGPPFPPPSHDSGEPGPPGFDHVIDHHHEAPPPPYDSAPPPPYDSDPPLPYDTAPPPPYDNDVPHYSGPPRPFGPRPMLRPSLLSMMRNRNNFLMHLFRRGMRPRPPFVRHFPRPRPYPPSPFPGMGGLYSPNPGYLVRTPH